jgi:hypothetical protein
MNKTTIIFGIVLLIVVCMCGCISFSNSKEEEFVLLPMDAPGDTPKDEPKTKESKPVEEKKTVPIAGKIIEYDKKNKTVKILLGSSNGLRKGMSGKIYNDAAKTQENGAISLTTVYSNYCEGQVKNIANEINKKEAIAVFELEE